MSQLNVLLLFQRGNAGAYLQLWITKWRVGNTDAQQVYHTACSPRPDASILMHQQIWARELLCSPEDTFRVNFTLGLQVSEFFRELVQSREEVGDRYSFARSPTERFVEA